MKVFALGFLAGLTSLFVLAFLFIESGRMPVASTSSPLPFEKFLARTALHAAYRKSQELHSPIPATEANELAGAKLYKQDCAFCHGSPDEKQPPLREVFFPPPPQLFRHGVADDPIGETYLKVRNGIRLSAMPAFVKKYSDEQIWQVSLLLSRGADISPATKQELLIK